LSASAELLVLAGSAAITPNRCAACGATNQDTASHAR